MGAGVPHYRLRDLVAIPCDVGLACISNSVAHIALAILATHEVTPS